MTMIDSVIRDIVGKAIDYKPNDIRAKEDNLDYIDIP